MILESEADARNWVFDTVATWGGTGAMERLEHYVAMLLDAGRTQNLIAASTFDAVWRRHIADSVQLLLYATDDTALAQGWLDLGSGGGLPGLVVASVVDTPVTMIESRRLRVDFLRMVAETLGLTNVNVVASNVRTAPVGIPAGVISARAFANLNDTLTMASRFAHSGTLWVLPKGVNAREELAILPKAWQSKFHVKHSITDADSLIVTGQGVFGGKERDKP